MSRLVKELVLTARQLVAPGKGILAADESDATIAKRFTAIGLTSTVDNRRDYRQLLFTTAGINQYLSGVILFDETIRQETSDGRRFSDVLHDLGIIAGIKVDRGAKPLAFADNETITEGLDGLRERLIEYRQLGARFAKWRAVIRITDQSSPSHLCVVTNAQALARYAALSQEQGIVPIVEPEVLMDGQHTIDKCRCVSEWVLAETFNQLTIHRVMPEALLLKPNMVIAGKDCPTQNSVIEVATETVACLKRHVPSAVPGIVFLSGGQSERQAVEHLQAMHSDNMPWALSFSFGRALQDSTLRAWAGKKDNVSQAQEIFIKRCKSASLARQGEYHSDME